MAEHPETKHGGDRKSEEIKRRNPPLDIPSFTQEVSDKTKQSERVIREEVQVATNIPERVQAAINLFSGRN